MSLLELTFGQQLALSLIGTLGTALVVTIGAGVFVQIVQRRLDQSRADRERVLDERWADRERQLDEQGRHDQSAAEQRRKDHEYERDLAKEERALRRDLVMRASETIGGFYFVTQSFWRQQQHPDIWGEADAARLDRDNVEWAKTADVFERQVASIYGWDSQPWELVHQARDLLTVRYFVLRGRGTDSLIQDNAEGNDGGRHSGLTADELEDTSRLLRAYKDCMKTLVDELLRAPTVSSW